MFLVITVLILILNFLYQISWWRFIPLPFEVTDSMCGSNGGNPNLSLCAHKIENFTAIKVRGCLMDDWCWSDELKIQVSQWLICLLKNNFFTEDGLQYFINNTLMHVKVPNKSATKRLPQKVHRIRKNP